LRTLVTVTDESFAVIAAFTFANSSPVTAASVDGPPRPEPSDSPVVPGEALGDGEAGSALARDAAPSTTPPIVTTPAAAKPILLLTLIDFIDT
jgi:hypothetical protein